MAAAAAAYLVFLGVWGLNYRREPLRHRLGFSAQRVSDAALVNLAAATVSELNGLHDAAWSRPWPLPGEIPPALASGFVQAQTDLPGGDRLSPAVPGRPKWSALTWYFERSGIDGMTDPFFLEVLVNQRLLPFERPFVVAHEWAHLAGYADEAEASFVGWLTCLRGDESTRYSGWLAIYLHVAHDLPETDREVLSALSRGPQQDVAAIIERYRRSNPAVRRAAGAVYDKFLKANRVKAGIASYDEVVTLILGTRFHPPGVPLPRTRQ